MIKIVKDNVKKVFDLIHSLIGLIQYRMDLCLYYVERELEHSDMANFYAFKLFKIEKNFIKEALIILKLIIFVKWEKGKLNKWRS